VPSSLRLFSGHIPQTKKLVFLVFGCMLMDALSRFDLKRRSHANSSLSGNVTTGMLMWRLRTGLSTAAGLTLATCDIWIQRGRRVQE